MGKFVDPTIKVQVINELRQGASFNHIMDKYPIKSKSTLSVWCRKFNINYIIPSTDKYDYALIEQMYKEGTSFKEIFKRFNIPEGTYNTVYKRLGLKFRPDQGNVRYFQNINTPQKAYILGFIAADGYICKATQSSTILGIQINKSDIEILEFIKEEMGFENNITYPNDNMCRITIANKDLVNDLYNLGITERKSKTIGNIIKNIPTQLHPNFIAGYLDGDGSIVLSKSPTKTTIYISFRGTKEFLQGLIDSMQLKNYYFNYDVTWVLGFAKITEVYKFYTLYKSSCFNLSRKINKFEEGIQKLILKYPKVQTISSPLLDYKK